MEEWELPPSVTHLQLSTKQDYGCSITELESAQQLVQERGGNLDLLDSDGDTLLGDAAKLGQLEVAQWLLKSGANIEAKNRAGKPPLELAFEGLRMDVAKLLIEKGATIDIYNENLFIDACEAGSLEMAQLLLERGASNDRRSRDRYNPLVAACKSGNLDLIQLLLNSGADIEGAGYTESPLYVASTRGHLEVVRLLLERGAQVDSVGSMTHPPLCGAAALGLIDVVKLLVDNGANVNCIDPLMAVHRWIPIFCSFEQFCAPYYTVPRNRAARINNLAVAKLLIEHGAEVNIVIENHTPLSLAVQKGNLEIVKLLLEKGANANVMISSRDFHRKTILCAAAASGKDASTAILSLLLDYGADIDCPTVSSYTNVPLTPLQYALERAYLDKIWLLACHGADQTKLQGSNSLSFVHSALLHFWTPQSHKYHPKCVKDAILCVLLIAKKNGWPFDHSVVHKICSYVAFGWYKPKFEMRIGNEKRKRESEK